jgi:hypothetical protein
MDWSLWLKISVLLFSGMFLSNIIIISFSKCFFSRYKNSCVFGSVYAPNITFYVLGSVCEENIQIFISGMFAHRLYEFFMFSGVFVNRV